VCSRRKSWVWAFLSGVAVLGLLGNLLARPASAESAPREYVIKAAFIYNFLKFVDWPGGGGSTLTIGVLGNNPFGAALNQLNGKSVKGKTVAVRKCGSVSDAESCQVVFISSSDADRQKQILDSLKSASILTVGESKGFAQRGGVINFLTEDDRVRFEVNPAAAERARLSISSEMLKLARIVKS
jgi:hypothetical protein